VHAIAPGRRAYVHLARGSVSASGKRLDAGDALKAIGESEIVLEDGRSAEVLLFDLA
ncbi:MAG: quercetin 2,3-dioxygenase, partial [Armatimonadetes bacterium]|nr:quercetin 2,3-dioxygenase [Armatimonadota bacterium]